MQFLDWRLQLSLGSVCEPAGDKSRVRDNFQSLNRKILVNANKSLSALCLNCTFEVEFSLKMYIFQNSVLFVEVSFLKKQNFQLFIGIQKQIKTYSL